MRLIDEHLTLLKNAMKHDTNFEFDGHVYDVADRKQRGDAIKAMTDACYYTDSQLASLSDLMLYEELTDTHPDKMTRSEYPFYSDTQLARRKGGVHRKNDGRGIKEVPMMYAENIGTDGKDYSIPTRRKRSERENRYIDEAAIARNKARRLRYRAFLRGELSGKFKVDIETGRVDGKISDIYVR